MTALLVLLVLLALLGIGATVHAVLTDGYGPVPDRSPVLPDRGRPRPVTGPRASDARSGRRRTPRTEHRPAAAQTR